ncbi:hypothetical protein M569_11957, partial [Genlisea aurea]
YIPLFRACLSLRSVSRLHAYLMVTGLGQDALASTKLIESYSQMGCLRSSTLIFRSFLDPDSFMWGVLIKCHVWNGLFEEAVALYREMLGSFAGTSSFIFPSVLRACSAMRDLRTGETVHAGILKSGLMSDSVIATTLMSMYGEAGRLFGARKVFDSMPVRDSVSCSSMITNLVREGEAGEGLEIFREMLRQGVEVDHVTLLVVAEACGQTGMLSFGSSCHGYAIRRSVGLENEALGSSLIAMYGKCGDLRAAEKLLFEGPYRKSLSSWTALISSYNQNGCYSEALRTFIDMQKVGLDGNSVTLMNVVCCCARLGLLLQGKSVHGYATRHGIDVDRDFLRSSLIDLYATSGNLWCAKTVFGGGGVHEKNDAVSWNVLISGYAKEGMAHEALRLFVQMAAEGVSPDSYALGSALLASGSVGLVDFGSQIHSSAIKSSRISNEFVENALIDMYSKCGRVGSGLGIFRDGRRRSVVAWNSMMCGFLCNGYSREVLSLFDEMDVAMDGVTFLTAIQACSNAGFVDVGKSIHRELIVSGLTDPFLDTALTDFYARCGELDTARRVFDGSDEKTVASWSSMIGGYAMHGRMDDSLALFDRMTESGVKPNDAVMMNVLSGCSHSGYVEKGKHYFELLAEGAYGIEPKEGHYGCVVDMLSRAGDVNSAYEAVARSGWWWSREARSAFVNGCRIHGRMEKISQLQKNGDDDDYRLLFNGYAEAGEWEACVEVRRKM